MKKTTAAVVSNLAALSFSSTTVFLYFSLQRKDIVFVSSPMIVYQNNEMFLYNRWAGE
jgi:hypothetical protein